MARVFCILLAVVCLCACSAGPVDSGSAPLTDLPLEQEIVPSESEQKDEFPGEQMPSETEPAEGTESVQEAPQSEQPSEETPAPQETGSSRPEQSVQPAGPGEALPVTEEPAAPGTSLPVTEEPAVPDTSLPATEGPAASDTNLPVGDASPKPDTTLPTEEEPAETAENEPVEPVQEDAVLKITVGDYELTATFEDNSSAEEFKQLLAQGPVTVEMDDYGGFEKVGSLGTTLTRNDRQITTEPGDVILYQGNQITIYYGTNTWSFTRLARIDDPTDLKAKLGEGTVQITFFLA